MVKQAQTILRKKSFGIRYVQKTDIHNAYGSLKYDKVIAQIKKDIPSAHWIIVLLQALSDYAPDNHLIIGGYLDAWLFNYCMSFALRYILSLGNYRRNKFYPWVINVSSYMDDFALYGRNKSSLAKAVKSLSGFLLDKFGLEIQLKENIIEFMSFKQEHERRKAKNNGCPCLDMGGYKIHRSYTTIRPKIFIRARRQYLRAWQEVQKYGTFRLSRANKLIAYYGYFKQTCSQNIYSKYHVEFLLNMARNIKSFWSKRNSKSKKVRAI